MQDRHAPVVSWQIGLLALPVWQLPSSVAWFPVTQLTHAPTLQRGVFGFCAEQFAALHARLHAPFASLQMSTFAVAVAQVALSAVSLPVAQERHAPVDSWQMGLTALPVLQLVSSVTWLPVAQETQAPALQRGLSAFWAAQSVALHARLHAPFASLQMSTFPVAVAQVALSAVSMPVAQERHAPVDSWQMGLTTLPFLQLVSSLTWLPVAQETQTPVLQRGRSAF
jgi:hypothetical protein